MTATEAFAWLRIGGAIAIAIAVMLGRADHLAGGGRALLFGPAVLPAAAD